MQDLRKTLRQSRAAIQGALRQEYSQRAAEHALQHSALQEALRVGIFMAMPEEIETQPLIDLLRQRGKILYLPYVYARQEALHWLPFPEHCPLEKDILGMLAPPYRAAEALSAADLDAIIVPLLGWNRQGQRLGMGGGYYDRSLAQSSAFRLGLAYQCQEALFTAQAWDIPLQALATEEQLYCF